MYSLASISKPITITGLMVLVERGLIDLDRPINDYLGEAKLVARRGQANDATVRRVASHTAGLPLHYQFFYADEPHVVPPRDETIRRYGLIYTPPGERYQYSNLGYGVLDYVIERVSDRSYASFMRDEVFIPLGMSDTYVNLPGDRQQDGAVRYGRDGQRLPFYDFDHPGASAVFSSARDLVRFGMFHLKCHLSDQEPILTDDSIDAMQVCSVSSQGDVGYGLGWALREHRQGYSTVAHSGGMPGVATALNMVPEAGLVVVVLCNGQGRFAYDLAERITQHALRDRVRAKTESFARAEPSGKVDAAESDSQADRLTPWIGHWQGTLATYAESKPIELWVEADRQTQVRLGESETVEAAEVNFVEDRLHGHFEGDLQTDDARRMPYRLHLNLELCDGQLCGAIVARSDSGRQVRALSHWVELHKD